MKRFAAVTTVLLFMGVLARPAAAQDVEVGLLGGVSIATFGGDAVPEEADPGSVTGLNIGALAQLPITDIISIQPELHYVQKGAELEGEGGTTVRFDLNYIELPVLLHVNVPTESRINFGFLLGPEVAFQTGCEVTFESAENEESFDCASERVDASLNFEDFDYGLIFGGSLGYGMPWGEIFLSGRYDLGLAGLFPDDPEEQLKNRAYYILVGFTVPLGGM